MDILFCNSPLEYIDNLYDNRIYIKREDKLPFSFGGNKVRFAFSFLEDMRKQGKDAIIAYGSKSSNLCRVVSQLCYDNNIPCAVVFSEISEAVTNNSIIVNSLGVREYFCHKTSVSQTIQKAIDDFTQEGHNPYYIYGSTLGKGNELTPVRSYLPVYNEIREHEKSEGITFDYIFLATGTAATYSGLLCSALKNGDNRNIIGISIAREAQRCIEIIKDNVNLCFKTPQTFHPVISDKYLCGGYSNTCKEMLENIDFIYSKYGIPLDPTYTGKAFWGMKQYLLENNIKDKNILFIHTGGYPIFCDYKNIRL